MSNSKPNMHFGWERYSNLQFISIVLTEWYFYNQFLALTSAIESSSLAMVSRRLSLAFSIASSFTSTASILDTILPIECSMRSTRRLKLTAKKRPQLVWTCSVSETTYTMKFSASEVCFSRPREIRKTPSGIKCRTDDLQITSPPRHGRGTKKKKSQKTRFSDDSCLVIPTG